MEIPFEKSFASYDKSKFWSSKNLVKPESVYKFSNKKYWFNCNICNHEFEATISNISLGQWCSYCNGNKLCEDNNCEFCFNRSFASYRQSQYWSILNDIQPRFVLKGSSNKYLFDCNKCSHTFNIMINKIGGENAWCPYCANKLCNDPECEDCFKNSFASHPKSKYWSNDNLLKPRDVRISSGKSYIFNCNICSHTFSSNLNNIVSGTWCPYCCVNSIVLCDNINCIQCYEKSFASSKMAKYWSPKNTQIPRRVFKKSDRKYLFKCDECNLEFSKRLLSIAYDSWCPYCKNKTEKKLYKWLLKHYITVDYQIKYDWCKNPKTNVKLPFDFEYENIIIELDGPQHYRQISNWRPVEEQRQLDKHKMDCALKNNKHIIRILQTDVRNNLSMWKDKLTDAINGLVLIEEPTIIYIGIDSTYFD